MRSLLPPISLLLFLPFSHGSNTTTCTGTPEPNTSIALLPFNLTNPHITLPPYYLAGDPPLRFTPRKLVFTTTPHHRIDPPPTPFFGDALYSGIFHYQQQGMVRGFMYQQDQGHWVWQFAGEVEMEELGLDEKRVKKEGWGVRCVETEEGVTREQLVVGGLGRWQVCRDVVEDGEVVKDEWSLMQGVTSAVTGVVCEGEVSFWVNYTREFP